MLTRWLVYHVASGHAFFTGAACLIVAACVSWSARRRGIRTARNALVLFGGTAVAVSATPLPAWADLLLVLVSLAWLAGEAFRNRMTLNGDLAYQLAMPMLASVVMTKPR